MDIGALGAFGIGACGMNSLAEVSGNEWEIKALEDAKNRCYSYSEQEIERGRVEENSPISYEESNGHLPSLIESPTSDVGMEEGPSSLEIGDVATNEESYASLGIEWADETYEGNGRSDRNKYPYFEAATRNRIENPSRSAFELNNESRSINPFHRPYYQREPFPYQYQKKTSQKNFDRFSPILIPKIEEEIEAIKKGETHRITKRRKSPLDEVNINLQIVLRETLFRECECKDASMLSMEKEAGKLAKEAMALELDGMEEFYVDRFEKRIHHHWNSIVCQKNNFNHQGAFFTALLQAYLIDKEKIFTPVYESLLQKDSFKSYEIIRGGYSFFHQLLRAFYPNVLNDDLRNEEGQKNKEEGSNDQNPLALLLERLMKDVTDVIQVHFSPSQKKPFLSDQFFPYFHPDTHFSIHSEEEIESEGKREEGSILLPPLFISDLNFKVIECILSNISTHFIRGFMELD